MGDKKDNMKDVKLKKEKEAVKEVGNNSNKIYINYNKRLLINIIGVVVFFFAALALLFASISVKIKSNVTYRQSSNLDYKVYLKPNDYYKTPYLQKNMEYIASLIDNVLVNFNYNFSANENISYRCTYYVKADVTVASTDGDRIIYSKSDRITEPKITSNKNSDNFSINENVKVNYSEYNDLVKGFKSSYGISANSNLVLSFVLNVTDEKGNIIGDLNNKDVMKLTIPLTEQMVNIKLDYKNVNNSNVANVYKDVGISNKITLLLAIISFVVSIGFLIKLLLFLNKTTIKKSKYDITLSKILREYDRVIVNSKNIIDLNDEVIDVNSFNELLDVRDNLEKPIVFSEIHKGQKAMFVVKTANETYRYILKEVDLESKDKH